MTDPFRLRVLKKLTTIIENSSDSNSNPNAVDLAGHVYRGRSIFGAGDEVPMVAILETPTPIDQVVPPETAASTSGLWDLFIQGIVGDDADNPLDPAYHMSAQVIAAIAEERRRPATVQNASGKTAFLFEEPRVLDILIGAPVHRPPDELSANAYWWVTLTLRTAEDLTNPYG